MIYFTTLWAEALAAQTPWVLLAAALALVLTRVTPLERPRLKAALFFTGTHVAALLVTAALAAVNSPLVDTARTPAWVLGAVAFVDSASVIVFAALLPRVRVHLPRIVQDVVGALLSVVVAVAVASRAGVNLSGLIATSAVITAVLGFSLQDVIGNVAGGLALQLDTSVDVGDWVKVGDVTGKVVDIRWRYVAIETRNWETVLVPNSVLMKSQVTVLGRRQNQPTQWRRWVYFSVDWRHQPSDVIAAVEAALRGVPMERVAKEPAPNCVLMDMSESVGRYAVRYWLTDLAVDDPTDSVVRTRIYFALKRAGITPALPGHAVFVTEDTTDRRQSKEGRELQRREALLRQCVLFASLSAEERSHLAQELKYAPFTGGEVLTRQGAAAHWLYVIESGEAKVTVRDGEAEREVARLTAGSFFGEMSLLTGAPRSATVTALTDVECYRLDKEAFKAVLGLRPELALELAGILSERQVVLDGARQALDAQTRKAQAETQTRDLLAKIRSFFSLGGGGAPS